MLVEYMIQFIVVALFSMVILIRLFGELSTSDSLSLFIGTSGMLFTYQNSMLTSISMYGQLKGVAMMMTTLGVVCVCGGDRGTQGT